MQDPDSGRSYEQVRGNMMPSHTESMLTLYSVDSKTESLMQDIVDTEFRDCTVLAVMHKLSSVPRYDMVALFGNGELLEIGRPAELIARNTQFSELYRLGTG